MTPTRLAEPVHPLASSFVRADSLLLVGESCGGQQQFRMHPHGIVRIHVFELNDEIAAGQKYRRNRQLVMRFSRGALQVNTMLP